MSHDDKSGRARGLARRVGIDEIASSIQKHRAELIRAGIGRIVLFGSAARGQAREGSDIDLAVEPQVGVVAGGLRLAGWRNMLADLLDRDVDVVATEFLRDNVRRAVEAEGVEVFHA